MSIIALSPDQQTDQQIILTKRRDNQRWGLPGGMVKWGEDISTTARRELAEETGLTLGEITDLIGVYSAPDRDPRLHSICIAVVAKVSGELNPSDRQEVMEARAFTRQNLPWEELAHDHDRQLQDFFNYLETAKSVVA